jgi:predicted Zn-dependent protease
MIARFLSLTAVLLSLAACMSAEAIDQRAVQEAASGLFSGGQSAEGGVPLFGNPSDDSEAALGREAYVNRIGRYVAAQSARPALPWTFAVIDSDDINAFSAPGGYVFVTRGLYALLQNEAELAGVLGHEIAHVNERHHVRLLQQNRVLLLGQELLTRQVKSEPVQKVAGTGLELYTRALDKEDEFGGDRLALLYAARAGYDPYAYVALLDRLGVGGDSDRLSLLFKTHPHPSDRVEALAGAIGNRWDDLSAGKAPTRLVPLPAPGR